MGFIVPDEVKDALEGATIENVRMMTDEEMEANMWYAGINGPAIVLELSNGAILYASRDPEGNGPGALFGQIEDRFLVFGPRWEG